MRKLRKYRKKTWGVDDFWVRKSTNPAAGKGLFSKVTIKPGDTIGHYTGKILSDKQAEEEPYVSSAYMLWVCKDCNILGEGELSNYTRFINHDEEGNGRIVTSTRWKKARIEATKIIRPGEEIFYNYGDYYWE